MLTSLALVLALGLPNQLAAADGDDQTQSDRPRHDASPLDLLDDPPTELLRGGGGGGGGGCGGGGGGGGDPLGLLALPVIVAGVAAVLVTALVTGATTFIGGAALATLVAEQEGRERPGLLKLFRYTQLPAATGWFLALAAGTGAVIAGLVAAAGLAVTVTGAVTLGGSLVIGGAVVAATTLAIFGATALVAGVATGILMGGIAADRMPYVDEYYAD